MTNRIDILNELREISTAVASINPVNIFSVPEGYFEALPDAILLQLNEQNNILDFETGQRMPNDIPTGYFENLADNILSKAKQTEKAEQETETLSPVLASISREMPNSLPDGYFRSFADNIQDKLEIKGAKVISLFERKVWVRYAAAAVFVGVVTLSALMIFKNKPVNNIAGNNQEKIESALPDEEIQQLANISDTELKTYTENSDIKSDDPSVNTVGDEIGLAAMANSDNLQEILQQLPDEAIQHYTNEQSTIKSSN